MARNKAVNATKAAKSTALNHHAHILTDSNCSPSDRWQVARSISGFSGRASPGGPPLMTTGEAQHIVYDDLKKANLLIDTFRNQKASLAQDTFPVGSTPGSAIFEFKDL